MSIRLKGLTFIKSFKIDSKIFQYGYKIWNLQDLHNPNAIVLQFQSAVCVVKKFKVAKFNSFNEILFLLF